MTFTEHLADIQARLRLGSYPNESAISQGVVLRVLGALGWLVYDPHIVYPEFTVKGRRVDFALCHPADKPRVFVEVKQPGQAKGADQQLFEYAFHIGVPMAVMTDGREWHVYVPAGAGSYDERRVYKLDLLERTSVEAAERLTRYLAYDRVRTEDAIRAARDDYDRIARSREGERHLPAAWAALLSLPDPALIALVAEKVESLCGVRPDEAKVEAFLQGREGLSAPPSVQAEAKAIRRTSEQQRPDARQPVSDAPASPDRRPVQQTSLARKADIGFTLDGVFNPARTAVDVYRRVVAALMARDPEFALQFAQTGGRTRAYLAKDRETLFPGRPDLQEQVASLPDGWILGLNVSRADIEKRLRLACDAAGLRYGKDLIVRL